MAVSEGGTKHISIPGLCRRISMATLPLSNEITNVMRLLTFEIAGVACVSYSGLNTFSLSYLHGLRVVPYFLTVLDCFDEPLR